MDTDDVAGDDRVERLVAQHEIERQIYQMGYHLEDGNFEAVNCWPMRPSEPTSSVVPPFGDEEVRQQYERTSGPMSRTPIGDEQQRRSPRTFSWTSISKVVQPGL
jgi:hypothetical protein